MPAAFPFASRLALAGIALCAMIGATCAQDLSYELYGGLGVRAESLVVSHDASGGNPLYGDPTSTLDYAPLTIVLPQLGIRGSAPNGAWYDLMFSGSGLAGGRFTDSDYLAGQVLNSETFSDVSGRGMFEMRLRAGLPEWRPWRWKGLEVEPYLTGAIGHRTLSALGLVCGAVCPAHPPIASDLHVIDQEFWSAKAGAGLRTRFALSNGGWLTLAGQLTAGATHISDSHNLRADLGPTPNVLYMFGTIGAAGHLGYTHPLTERLNLELGLDAGANAGFGVVDFAPHTATPMGPFPATMTDLSATVTAGLASRF